jgi:hypothetical protein
MTSHKLTPEYLARVERFAVTFPAACEFLRQIESEGPAHGLWLSTAVNAHLYKGASFLAYVKLKNPDLRPPSLVWSPHFNQQIATDTQDESSRLFPRAFNDVLAAHGARGAGWVRRHAGGVTELAATTPRALFAGLWEVLGRV